MAERRMFAKAVINSARFLRMPQSTRLLYYDLGMAADDDGIVEAFTVIRTTGAAEDDLKVLVSKGFVTILNEDLVSYIVDWKRNNYIQKDRYAPSVYAELLVKIKHDETLNSGVNQPLSNSDTERIQDVYTPDTQVSIDKVSIDKVSLDHVSLGEGIQGEPSTSHSFNTQKKEKSALKCSDCGKNITENIADYSKKNYGGKVLCMDCQKHHKRNSPGCPRSEWGNRKTDNGGFEQSL